MPFLYLSFNFSSIIFFSCFFAEFPGVVQDVSLRWDDNSNRLQLVIVSRTGDTEAASRITFFELPEAAMDSVFLAMVLNFYFLLQIFDYISATYY